LDSPSPATGAAINTDSTIHKVSEALYVAWFRVKEPANSSLSIF
jgi:hypothetical protein